MLQTVRTVVDGISVAKTQVGDSELCLYHVEREQRWGSEAPGSSNEERQRWDRGQGDCKGCQCVATIRYCQGREQTSAASI
jgi:hypothetical protein